MLEWETTVLFWGCIVSSMESGFSNRPPITARGEMIVGGRLTVPQAPHLC
jgi:hypothetical protein